MWDLQPIHSHPHEQIIPRRQIKTRRNMAGKSKPGKTTPNGRNKANMQTSECIYPPKIQELEKEESGRAKVVKSPLPPNVIGTQLTGKVKRFGVKLRYNGCPLRIGSAYCTPEDASKVASVFRDCIQIDSKGNLFFAQDVLNKYRDLYVIRPQTILPTTSHCLEQQHSPGAIRYCIYVCVVSQAFP